MSTIFGRQLGFGAGGIVGGRSAAHLLDLAQSADELGYDLFTLSDHLHSQRPTFEPWTALTWIAAKTKNIGVGTNVLGLPYRPPPVLAKMAETLDRVSGGRLVLGLGAGGYDHEFTAFGLSVRSPGEKISAQREAIHIMRALWAQESTSFVGEQFTVREARIDPPPTHPIPIWLGSYGPRALAMTGQIADGWLPSLGRMTLGEASAMREVVRSSARAAGRDPDAITCACNIGVRVDPAQAPSPGTVAGSVPAVVEQLVAIVEAGFTFLLIGSTTVQEQELLAREVIPQVRAEVAARDILHPTA